MNGSRKKTFESIADIVNDSGDCHEVEGLNGQDVITQPRTTTENPVADSWA